MANPLPTQGISFFWTSSTAWSTGSTNSTCLVGFVTDISGPTASKNEIEVTSMNSSAKEFLMGLPDFGEIQLSVNFAGTTEPTHTALWNDFISASNPQRKWVLKFTDAATSILAGAGYVKGYSFSAAKEDSVKATITIRCSGPATLSTAMA